MVRMLQNLALRAKGFKKVMLKDTKGVLTKANNFKWVKETDDFVETVLPSGTKIYKDADAKIVIKPDGTITQFYKFDVDHVIDEFSPFKLIKGKTHKCYDVVDETILKERTLEESKKLRSEAAKQKAEAAAKALRAKREKFVEQFNEKYERVIKRSADGSQVSKGIYEKATKKLVGWYRKNKNTGAWSKGSIKYMPAEFGKEVFAESSKGQVYKSVTNAMGNKSITRVELPDGDITKAIVTEKTNTKIPTKDDVVAYLEQLGKAFEEIAAKMN